MTELYKFRVRSYDEVKKKCVFRSYEVKLPISSPLSYSHFAEHKSNYIYAYGMAFLSGSCKKSVKIYLDNCFLLED